MLDKPTGLAGGGQGADGQPQFFVKEDVDDDSSLQRALRASNDGGDPKLTTAPGSNPTTVDDGVTLSRSRGVGNVLPNSGGFTAINAADGTTQFHQIPKPYGDPQDRGLNDLTVPGSTTPTAGPRILEVGQGTQASTTSAHPTDTIATQPPPAAPHPENGSVNHATTLEPSVNHSFEQVQEQASDSASGQRVGTSGSFQGQNRGDLTFNSSSQSQQQSNDNLGPSDNQNVPKPGAPATIGSSQVSPVDTRSVTQQAAFINTPIGHDLGSRQPEAAVVNPPGQPATPALNTRINAIDSDPNKPRTTTDSFGNPLTPPDVSSSKGKAPDTIIGVTAPNRATEVVQPPPQSVVGAQGGKTSIAGNTHVPGHDIGGSNQTLGPTDKSAGARPSDQALMTGDAKVGPKVANANGVPDGITVKPGPATPVEVGTLGTKPQTVAASGEKGLTTGNNPTPGREVGGSNLVQGPNDRIAAAQQGAAGKNLDATGKPVEADRMSASSGKNDSVAGKIDALAGKNDMSVGSSKSTEGIIGNKVASVDVTTHKSDIGGTSISSRASGDARTSDAATMIGKPPDGKAIDAKAIDGKIADASIVGSQRLPVTPVEAGPFGTKRTDVAAQGNVAASGDKTASGGSNLTQGDRTAAAQKGVGRDTSQGKSDVVADVSKAGKRESADSRAESKKSGDKVVEAGDKLALAGGKKDGAPEKSKVFDAIVGKALADLNFNDAKTRDSVQALLKRLDLALLNKLDEKSRLKMHELVDQATKGQGLERLKRGENAEATAKTPKSFMDKLADFLHINKDGVIGKQVEVLKNLATHIREVSRAYGLPTDKTGLTISNVVPPGSFETAFANALLNKQGPEITRAALTKEISHNLKSLDVNNLEQKPWFGELDKQGQKIVMDVATALHRARELEEAEIKSPTEFINKLLEIVYDKEINKKEEILVEAVMLARGGSVSDEEAEEKVVVKEQLPKPSKLQKNTMYRRPYIVRLGDTLESIAHKQLGNPVLANLIFAVNDIQHIIVGERTIVDLPVGLVIFLPTEDESSEYLAEISGKPTTIFEYKEEHYDPTAELKARYGDAEDYNDVAAELKQAGVLQPKEEGPLHMLNKSVEEPVDTVLKAMFLRAETPDEPIAAEMVAPVVPDDQYRQIVQKKGREPINDGCKIKVEALSDYVRLVKYEGGSGEPGHPQRGVQLQVNIDGQWSSVSTYEVYSQLSVKFEYSADGHYRDLRFDLPAESVWEMAANDLAQNWEAHYESYSANLLPHKI